MAFIFEFCSVVMECRCSSVDFIGRLFLEWSQNQIQIIKGLVSEHLHSTTARQTQLRKTMGHNEKLQKLLNSHFAEISQP